MKHKKALVWLMATLFILGVAGVVFGQAVTTKATVTNVEKNDVTFKTEKGEDVKSRVSSSRTKFEGVKEVGEIGAGSEIEITYTADGARNEPSLIKVTKKVAAEKREKLQGDVGWITLDKKTLVVVKEGKHVADIELPEKLQVKLGEMKIEEKPGQMTDVLSGHKVTVEYVEKDGKKTARSLLVIPVSWGGDEED